MAKLMFQTDDGTDHEVSISSIKTKGLGEGDVVLAKYEVGDLPEDKAHLAGQALAQLKSVLEGAFPEGVKVIVVATRSGKDDVSIKIVKDKTVK